MKLKMLREHYRSTRNGDWVPKKAFESREEIATAGYLPNKWSSYICGVCIKYHVATIQRTTNDG